SDGMESMSPREQLQHVMATDGYVDIPRDGPPGMSPPRQLATNGKAPKRKEASGRFQTLNTFVDESARLVSTTAQTVWMVLWRDTHTDGIANVSHSRIADRLGISRRTVIRAINELEKQGLVTVVKRGG